MADNDDSAPYGQRTRDSTVSEATSALSVFEIKQALGRISTIKKVRVVKVTNNGGVEPVGLLDVVPMVHQMDAVGKTEPHGTIYQIPYVRSQAGGHGIIIDPQVGDIGYIAVCDRDSSGVKKSKKDAGPGSHRRFSLADSIYLGGILNDTPVNYIRFFGGDNDGGIEIHDKHGNIVMLNEVGIKLTDRYGNFIEMNND